MESVSKPMEEQMKKPVLTERDIPGHYDPATGEKKISSHNDSDEVLAQEREDAIKRREAEKKHREEIAKKFDFR